MVDYNVLGGKCNRVLFVIDSYNILKSADVLSQEEIFLACTLGWCIEWVLNASQWFYFQACVLNDNSSISSGRWGLY
jgi:farnesyl diphosphate synthase